MQILNNCDDIIPNNNHSNKSLVYLNDLSNTKSFSQIICHHMVDN